MTHRLGSLAGVIAGCLLVSGSPVVAQDPDTIRLALVPQWLIDTNAASTSPLAGRRLGASFADTLERGVTDGIVFAWQRGRIQRSSLVTKPIRVLSADQARPLGGRGDFRLAALHPATGVTAWTDVQIASLGDAPDDVLVLEVGGDVNTITQVIGTLLVAIRPGEFQEQRLGLRALVEDAERVPIVRVPFGRAPSLARVDRLFRGTGGVEFLVARGLVDAVTGGEVTPNGVADVAQWSAGDWRESDRLFVRVPLRTLRQSPVGVVLAWRDRTLRDDPGGEPPESLLPRRTGSGLRAR